MPAPAPAPRFQRESSSVNDPQAPIALIAAMAENRVIGRDNQLPWRVPEDLRHFRQVTLGKPVVMGRKTYDSIGRPLPGRCNIVVSGDPAFAPEGVTVCRGLADALAEARRVAIETGAAEIMVIGGATLYTAALPLARRLYLTRVHAVFEGDVLFPELPLQEWHQVASERLEASDERPFALSFDVFERAR